MTACGHGEGRAVCYFDGIMSSTTTPSASPDAANAGASVQVCPTGKVDVKGRFIFADEHIEVLFGLSQEELFGRSLKEFLDDSQHHILDRLLVRHSRFETVYESAELLFYDADGEPLPRTLIVSLNFVAGNPVNFQIVFLKTRDASTLSTATLSSRAAISESGNSASTLMELLSQSGLALAHCDVHGSIQGMNDDLHSLVPESESISNIDELLERLVSDADLPIARMVIADSTVNPDVGENEGGQFVGLRRGEIGFLWPLTFGDAQATERLIIVVTNSNWTAAWGSETALAATAASMTDRLRTVGKLMSELGHQEFTNLKGKAQRKLATALAALKSAEDEVAAMARQTDLLCGPAACEAVDLNLSAGQLFDRLRATYPSLKLSLSYDNLAKVRTSARHLDWFLETVAANLIDASNADAVTLTLETENRENGIQLFITADHPLNDPGDARKLLLQPRTAHSDLVTGQKALLVRITEGCLGCMRASIDDVKIDESRTVIGLLLPTHTETAQQASQTSS